MSIKDYVDYNQSHTTIIQLSWLMISYDRLMVLPIGPCASTLE